MKKRFLSLLLVVAMLLVLSPQYQTEAEAHTIVMTAEKFIDCLWTAYNRPNVYRNVFPYNLGYYDGRVIYFDCWNLGKAIIWSKGSIVNNYTVGTYAPMDSSCGLGDWDGLSIVKAAPNCSSNFTNLVPGEWLYMDNHTGYYVGNGQVIECTAGWNVWGITVSQIDKYGNRSRNGVSGGSWKLHGMVPWLDYSGYIETWIEKACFDPTVYRDRNKDLAGYTDEKLKEHWLAYGIKEGRSASAILDLRYYVENNPDLKTAFGSDYTKAYNHFITKGYKEYRKSSLVFDGKYYTDNHKDVAQTYKELYLKHYVDNGMREGRRASLTFDPDYYWFTRPDVAATWPGDYQMCIKHYAGHGIKENRVGYDRNLPVISDVVISDVTAAGYTVSCKVTDNWGISKVAFPTWTVANNQDDLAKQFMDTQLGTKNGDIYTFRVNASDHNNEGGEYVTHIYAVDKGDNQTVLHLDSILVQDPEVAPEPEPELEQIWLSTTAEYARDGDLITNVQPCTTVVQLLTRFENQGLEVLDKTGAPLADTAQVGTGTTLNLYIDGELADTVTVVILGDLDGSGGVDLTDYMRVRAAILGALSLGPAEHAAADVDFSGTVNTTDYMRIKAYFLGEYQL